MFFILKVKVNMIVKSKIFPIILKETYIMKKYEINHTELTCINILIKIIQEAIARDTFSNNEIENIIKTINKLNNRSNQIISS